MNREEFFAKLSPLDEDGLRKVLWNLYWRGSAPLRERIEGELDPAEHDRRKRAAVQPADPDWVLYEAREFAELARAGAYIGGDRRVSPKERTRWRVTFRRLAADAQSALRAQDAGPAEEALALVIDLACEMRDRSYFRSEDPVEAARFVVSDAAAMLWESMQDRYGSQTVAERAAEQLIRWESRYGWTREWGQVREKETSLARVLARMLRVPDLWTVFADRYLEALDQVARAEAAKPKSRRPWEYPDADYVRRHRTGELAEWHELLLDRLAARRPRTASTGLSAIPRSPVPSSPSCRRGWPTSEVTSTAPASWSRTACRNSPGTRASRASRRRSARICHPMPGSWPTSGHSGKPAVRPGPGRSSRLAAASAQRNGNISRRVRQHQPNGTKEPLWPPGGCPCGQGAPWQECCGPRERAALSRFTDRSGLMAL
jgi:hypothetical protein